jgi:AcrR family transcriptional regulator
MLTPFIARQMVRGPGTPTRMAGVLDWIHMKPELEPPFAFAAEAAEELPARLTPRRPPAQARSRATVDVIVEAAIQVLADQGYARLTTTRVAKRAGVSVGTLYQYFPGKPAIMAAVESRYLDAISREVIDAAQAAHGLPLADAVEKIVRAFVAVKQRHADAARALRPFIAEEAGDVLARAALRRVVEALAVLLASVSDAAIVEPEQTAAIVAAAVEGPVSFAMRDAPDWLSRPSSADELTAIALGYLRLRCGPVVA